MLAGSAAGTAQPVTAAEIRAAGFGVEMRGYARRDVDTAIASALAEIEARGTGNG